MRNPRKLLSLVWRRLNRKDSLYLAWALILIGVTALIASVFIIYKNSHRAEPQDPLGTTQAVPSSIKPTQKTIAAYSVAPDLPKYISIPAIDITQTRIIQLGLLNNGQIATPDNIYDTGWYNGSAKPGQNGAMFIYGHVSSWTADGIFYNLNKLKSGNTVTIVRGDNTTFTYRVVSLKVYPYTKVDMHAVLSPVSTDTPGLNLMTCTGQVIKGTSEFNERLVVFTSLVKTS